eukprot:SAG25_NODE_7785_length_459_cov_1.147222_1_plen_103_part_01
MHIHELRALHIHFLPFVLRGLSARCWPLRPRARLPPPSFLIWRRSRRAVFPFILACLFWNHFCLCCLAIDGGARLERVFAHQEYNRGFYPTYNPQIKNYQFSS